MPLLARKNWDEHVADAEEVARCDAFQAIRDRIVELASPTHGEVAVDIGSGTGLLSLMLAPRVTQLWAIDISPHMCDYLRTKVASADLANVHVAVASAVSLPLVDDAADIVVSNYCLHHLRDADKERAIAEAYRVLRPGGHLVIGDMMFSVGVATPRDRRVILSKAALLLKKGPAGVLRLLKNALRFVTGRWERPSRPEWWRDALVRGGFEQVELLELEHEGGIAAARKPAQGDSRGRGRAVRPLP